MESNARGSAQPARSYRIVVRGELSRRYSPAFDGMALVAGEGHTAIVGPVIDQAHLYGLLARISDLGLELVSLNPQPNSGSSNHARQDPAARTLSP
jgi:hypothetical protein